MRNREYLRSTGETRAAQPGLSEGQVRLLAQTMAKAMYAVHKRLEFYTEREVNAPANHQEFREQAKAELQAFNDALVQYNEWAKAALAASQASPATQPAAPQGAVADAIEDAMSKTCYTLFGEIPQGWRNKGYSEVVVPVDAIREAIRAALPAAPQAPTRAEETLRLALRESGCDGDLCTHRWHELAQSLIREIDEARAAAL